MTVCFSYVLWSKRQCELYSQLVMTTRLFLTSLLFKPFRFLFLAVCISGSGRLMQTWNEFLYSLDFSRILKFDYRMKNYQDFFPSYSLPQLWASFTPYDIFPAHSRANWRNLSNIDFCQFRNWLSHEKNHGPHSVYVWLQRIRFEIQMIYTWKHFLNLSLQPF